MQRNEFEEKKINDNDLLMHIEEKKRENRDEAPTEKFIIEKSSTIKSKQVGNTGTQKQANRFI